MYSVHVTTKRGELTESAQFSCYGDLETAIRQSNTELETEDDLDFTPLTPLDFTETKPGTWEAHRGDDHVKIIA